MVISTSTPRVGAAKSNTGAIAGGVVGGVIGLALIALIAFLLYRRKKKNDFDGNFDPSRNVERPATLPIVDLDLSDDAQARPYEYTPSTSGPPTSPSHYTSSEGGLLAGGAAPQMSEHSGPSSSGVGGMSARMAKQQEAARQYGGQQGGAGPVSGQYGVANPDEVIVHRDGGRVPAGAEIPPTYDSIPEHER